MLFMMLTIRMTWMITMRIDGDGEKQDTLCLSIAGSRIPQKSFDDCAFDDCDFGGFSRIMITNMTIRLKEMLNVMMIMTINSLVVWYYIYGIVSTLTKQSHPFFLLQIFQISRLALPTWQQHIFKFVLWPSMFFLFFAHMGSFSMVHY